MIVSLISFALKRDMTAEVAGPSLEESKWGFGQVMALTTWLPTVADFVLVFQGNLKAVEYRLPLGVDVSIPRVEKELLGDERGDEA
ncbi:hypothetical protein B0T16DRAFT_408322 [Cercophora newfieldiana]|uniref:Uncharacterized protein n=1 Tax=Cercophora newfieldiana TaxID=92897 RepID=A0AA39Y9H8_9PEZI|nr:hypothetical protein B0T16DRAFT_408322 [Cercophora newfieldiana]